MTLAPDILRMVGRLGAAFCLRKPFCVNQSTATIEACLDGLLQETRHDAMVPSTAGWIGGTPARALHLPGRATGVGTPEVLT
jgi:hypothetical protein